MKIPVRTYHSNNRVLNQEKLEARESWHKLVVKIISWKDGISNKTFKLNDKISPKEWEIYCERKMEINLIQGKDKVLKMLEDTKKIIKIHRGFSK